MKVHKLSSKKKNRLSEKGVFHSERALFYAKSDGIGKRHKERINISHCAKRIEEKRDE